MNEDRKSREVQPEEAKFERTFKCETFDDLKDYDGEVTLDKLLYIKSKKDNYRTLFRPTIMREMIVKDDYYTFAMEVATMMMENTGKFDARVFVDYMLDQARLSAYMVLFDIYGDINTVAEETGYTYRAVRYTIERGGLDDMYGPNPKDVEL